MPVYPAVDDDECAHDPSILDTDILLRRIHPTQWTVEIAPDDTKRLRPTSDAFKDSTDPPSPLSSAQQKLIEDAARYMAVAPDFLLVSFPASLPRQKNLVVSSTPAVAGEPEHVYIAGKKTRSIIKHLAQNSAWVIEPPPGTVPPTR